MELSPTVCYRAVRARDARYDGRFFTCVKTTGIYCRPICPARPPKLENCTFVPTAAAAQAAAYRPCLRCRPESSPELDAWRGTEATVSRALRLIEDGVLDDGSVAALAERLQIGDRQLRRLFSHHVGAAPIAVAQTRRVLLAKQLIHQTNLPMIEVALASGFGSVRRFNETFQQLYGRPPGELRRHATGSAAPEITILLPYRPPYDWETMLRFFQVRAITGVEVVTDESYGRVIATEEGVGTIHVTHAPQRSSLRATIRLPRFESLAPIIARIRRQFDLAAEPNAIAAVLSADPLLAKLVAKRPGLRVPGGWDGFETAVRAVLGQQITLTGAMRIASKLVAQVGTVVGDQTGVDGLTHLFPTPNQIQLNSLPGLGLTTARATALVKLAQAAIIDKRLFEPRGDLSASVAHLKSLPGIGEWTAQYIALRALGECDAFLAADVGVQRRFGSGKQRPSAEQMLVRAESWRPWRAYATLYLWMADDELKNVG